MTASFDLADVSVRDLLERVDDEISALARIQVEARTVALDVRPPRW